MSSTDSKRTRASGEVLDFLITEFQRNPNPNPEQRKFISDRAGMNEKAVRIWFQNRRAKIRKFERLLKQGSNGSIPQPPSSLSLRSSYNRYSSIGSGDFGSFRISQSIPIEVNDKYCFIDCSSLSVGSWQRLRTGYHDDSVLRNNLLNLSPFTLNSLMHNVDLLVLLSKKNFEINYFFLAISNNSKILFRIFYPINSISTCSLLDNNINKENNELRLTLMHQPKFSVYFFDGINSNSNQWSICDDFSEGQQVSQAYIQEDVSTTIPHVLVGPKSSLQYLNLFILENNQVYTKVVSPPAPISVPGQSGQQIVGQANERIQDPAKAKYEYQDELIWNEKPDATSQNQGLYPINTGPSYYNSNNINNNNNDNNNNANRNTANPATASSNNTNGGDNSPFSIHSNPHHYPSEATSPPSSTQLRATTGPFDNLTDTNPQQQQQLMRNSAPTPDIFSTLSDGAHNEYSVTSGQTPSAAAAGLFMNTNDNDSLNSPSMNHMGNNHAYTHQTYSGNNDLVTNDDFHLGLGEFGGLGESVNGAVVGAGGTSHLGSNETGVDSFIDFGSNYP